MPWCWRGVVLAVLLVVVVVGLVPAAVLVKALKAMTIYVNTFATVLFLVRALAKLKRERFLCCPRLFREEAGRN